MKTNLLEKCDELLKNADSLTIPQLATFVHEMLGFFEQIRQTLKTGSEDEKKQAIEVAVQVQEKLKALSEKAYKSIGMSPDEAEKLLNPQNFSSDEWNLFKNVEGEIDEYQKELSNDQKEQKSAEAPRSKRSARRKTQSPSDLWKGKA
jgi:HPt (histidine-containing phosphotransfer) domain-containing protein